MKIHSYVIFLIVAVAVAFAAGLYIAQDKLTLNQEKCQANKGILMLSYAKEYVCIKPDAVIR